jgi:hypothetical protein
MRSPFARKARQVPAPERVSTSARVLVLVLARVLVFALV